MASYDRAEVLARTDLGELADQVIAPRKGRGAGATWPCPSPNHGPQTGKTPPVSIFRAQAGHERWRCHGCGDGGTAVDLVMRTQGLDFRASVELLAARAGVSPDVGARHLRPTTVERAAPRPAAGPNPELEAHVRRCEALLWSDPGRVQRIWLKSRGLGEEVLRANRVGADPGPRALPRPPGLPRGGPAVVFPVLGPDRRAEYLQARYLHAGPRKYDNPTARFSGTSPRVADVRLARPAQRDDLVVVCEGLPDALTAAQAGYRAAGVLGAGYPDERVARGLVSLAGGGPLVVAFDSDERGREGGDRLVGLLEAAGAGGRVHRLHVPTRGGDLNDWRRTVGDGRFGTELEVALSAAGVVEAAGRRQDQRHHVNPAGLEVGL